MVNSKMKKEIYIVCGGNSLKDFDFSKLDRKDVIAVNKSILDVPESKYFVTMDYTFIDRIIIKTDNRLTKESFFRLPSKKYFIVATNNSYIRFRNNQYVDVRYDYKYDLTKFNEVIVSNKDVGIGGNFYEFVHGCNSGFCALQLAILLEYKIIHLLGVDLIVQDKTHYHSGYNQNKWEFGARLDFYYPFYVSGIHNIKIKFPNIKLYSYSPNTKLNNYIEYKSLEDIK